MHIGIDSHYHFGKLMRQDTRGFSTDGEPNGDQKVKFCSGHVVSGVAQKIPNQEVKSENESSGNQSS